MRIQASESSNQSSVVHYNRSFGSSTPYYSEDGPKIASIPCQWLRNKFTKKCLFIFAAILLLASTL